MFHQTLNDAASAEVLADRREAITIGDIIKWPLSAAGNNLALVVDIDIAPGMQLLTIAPGVADHAQPVRPGTFRLARSGELRRCGLTQAIRFDLNRRISVSPQHSALHGAASPVIARLCAAALERLHVERARLHALRDMATARREEGRMGRRPTRPGDTRTGWRRASRPVGAEFLEGQA